MAHGNPLDYLPSGVSWTQIPLSELIVPGTDASHQSVDADDVSTGFLGAVLSKANGSFIGLYMFAPTATYIRDGGQWNRATGSLLSQVNDKQLVEIDGSKLTFFDELQSAGNSPTTDQIAAMSTSGGPGSWDTQQNARQLRGAVKRHHGPAVWESKVRGLMLGLALGDALGSTGRLIPSTGALLAGAATQLAAWTAEGLLRRTTRYGLYAPSVQDEGWPLITDHIEYSNRRWLIVRQGKSGGFRPAQSVMQYPGWLSEVPAMAENRGHSPSMERAITSGVSSGANSCRPVIKTLPLAVYAGSGRFSHSTAAQAGTAAGEVASTTHHNPQVRSATGAVVCIAVHCLRESESFLAAMERSLGEMTSPTIHHLASHAMKESRERSADPSVLREIAPDDTPRSVLAGAIYVAASYPDWGSTNDALALARSAPDGDGVAAIVGAFLGALHGYEVFPTALLSRLELGWVMDRLAIDLALEVKEEQVPSGGWKEGGTPWLEPWWDAKYPGV
ncbi:ADP-ribosylglycohydrolase family protein [Microbacterium sp. A84]